MECPICLDNFNSIDEIIQLSCCIAHYHKKCIHKWAISNINNPTCPCCRKKLVLKKTKKYYILQIIFLLLCMFDILLFIWYFCDISFTKENFFQSIVIFIFACFIGLLNVVLAIILDSKLKSYIEIDTRIETINPMMNYEI